jgi:hypothetical protein
MTLSAGDSQKQSPNLFMHGTVIYLTVTASIVTAKGAFRSRMTLGHDRHHSFYT